MNLETNILVEKLNINVDEIQIPNLSDEEKSLVEKYIEITRHIKEIDQLFHIFRFNVKNTLSHYKLHSNDTIESKVDTNFEESDYIIINAYVINIISSGKTLIESIEIFMKENIGEDSEKYINFKLEYLSKIYDDIFSYRFLMRIRDLSQHGHLPLCIDFNNQYCFDLDNLLSTPHFNHNKKIKGEMENIREDIYNKYSDNPKIMFTRTLAEFNFAIIKIYMGFLDSIEADIFDHIGKINCLLKTRPDIVHVSDDFLNGYIFYDIINNSLQCFDSKDDSEKMFLEFKQNILLILKKEERELQLLNDCYKKNN